MSQSGAKIILFHRASLVSILRDDLASIRYPNYWDLPGGGIERGETAFEAIRREVDEELGLEIHLNDIVWKKTYKNTKGLSSHFFAAPIGSRQLNHIRFGDEGQRWALMLAEEFCVREDAVPHFQPRVAEFFAQR